MPGVDEIDYVKLVGSLLYVLGAGRRNLVYRVDLGAREPLPLSTLVALQLVLWRIYWWRSAGNALWMRVLGRW